MPAHRGDPAVYRGRAVAWYRLLNVLRQRAGPWIRGRPGGCRADDGAPGDLALAYVGPAMAAVLDVAAVLSALGAALVGVAVAPRTLYALARDRILASAMATVSHQTGTRPAR